MKLKSWRELVPLTQALYRRHGAGCCWHIALDDGNLEDDSVEFCAKEAAREGHPDCLALVEPMRAASLTQRKRLYGASR